MAETWPAQLADYVNQSGFQLQFGDTTIRSEMDVGPAKVRRRYTKPVDTYSVSIILNKDDYATFYTFYDTTLNGGVNTFTFDNPITGVASEYRFASPPSIAPLGGETFTVTMQWEELPV